MFNFYPGPSKIQPQIPALLADGFAKGVFEYNHRSTVFHAIYEKAEANLRSFLDVPVDYEIYFVSSATECWHTISRGVIRKSCLHIYNGAFGEKWMTINEANAKDVSRIEFTVDQLPELLPDITPEVVCLTHCETSNGTKLPDYFLQKVRATYLESLICIDATSSLGGIPLSSSYYDIAFASVQKCFGFPAGLALMICSPKAVLRALEIRGDNNYSSIMSLHANYLAKETTHTPNIMGIYLFSALKPENLHQISEKLIFQSREIKESLKAKKRVVLGSHEQQSETIICVEMEPDEVRKVLNEAEKNQLILGKGYGIWKNNSVRIANFPAHSPEDILYLQQFIMDQF